MVSTTTPAGDEVDSNVATSASTSRQEGEEEALSTPPPPPTAGRISRVFGFVKNLVFKNRTSESAARAMDNGDGGIDDEEDDNRNARNTNTNTNTSSSDDKSISSSSFASMSLRSIISISSIMEQQPKSKVKFSGQVLIRVIPNLDDIGDANRNLFWWQRNDYDTFEHNNTRIEELMTKSYYGTIGLTAGRRTNSRGRNSRQQQLRPPRRSNSADSYDSTATDDSNDGSIISINGTRNGNGGGDINQDRFEYCTRGLECRTPIAERQRSKSRDDARQALFSGPFGSGAMFENNEVIAENYERACYSNVQAAYMRGLYDEKVTKELLQDDDEFLIYYHNAIKKTDKQNQNGEEEASPSSTSIVPPPPSYYGTPSSAAVSPAQLQTFRKEREKYMKSRSKRRYRTTNATSSSVAGATGGSLSERRGISPSTG